MIVFQVINMLSGVRHLACVLRKSHMCACGCAGWCTLHCAFTFLAWSFGALAEGVHPRKQWDGADWASAPDRDVVRAHLAGQGLGFRAAVVMIRGDWAEYALSFGFPTWASKDFPCIWCKTPRDKLTDTVGVTALRMPCERVTPEEYQKSCEQAEIWVTIDKRQHAKLLSILKYDKRAQGTKGRSLTADFEELSLVKWDRLEPHAGLMDTAKFDDLVSFPARVLFWRRSEETRARRRNPLFREDIGLSHQSLATDALHALHLGVYMVYVAKVFWMCIDHNVWGVPEHKFGGRERNQISVMRMRSDLWKFYKDYQAAHPGEQVSKVEDLTLGMLGTPTKLHLATKAVETKCLFFWQRRFCGPIVIASPKPAPPSRLATIWRGSSR